MHSDLQFECAVPVANLTFEFGMLQSWIKGEARIGATNVEWCIYASRRVGCHWSLHVPNVWMYIVSLCHCSIFAPYFGGEHKEKLPFWYGCCRPFLKIIEDGQPFLFYHKIFPQYSHNALLSSIIPHVVPIRHGTHWVYPIVTMATKFRCWNCHHTNSPGSLRLTQEDNEDSCQQSNHQSDHQNDGDQDAELRWWKWDVWHRDGAVVKQESLHQQISTIMF